MASKEQCQINCGHILFRIGQQFLVIGVIMAFVGVCTTHWVVRPSVDYARYNVNASTTVVTKNYGLFQACRQSKFDSGRGECGSLWDNVNYINENTVKFIQFLAVVSCILYVVSIGLEVLQLIPIDKYRNFVAENRIVEMVASTATVIMLTAMVIFAGEIKNKAQRVSGQEDEESGWSFIITLVGLCMCVIGLVLVTMLRELPIPKPGLKGGTWLRVASQASG